MESLTATEFFGSWTAYSWLLAIAFFIIGIVILIGCLQCFEGLPFRALDESAAIVNTPASMEDGLATVAVEPIPDLKKLKLATLPPPLRPRPAAFSTMLEQGVPSVQDWFDAPRKNFPRQQLQYVRNIGIGWFGQAIDGYAQNILVGEERTRVIVKSLKEDAATIEQCYFLIEAKPFRKLDHSNVLKMLGQCLENSPYLLIYEHCAFGDLKTYLLTQRTTAHSVLWRGLLLKMSCDVASGLEYMHRHSYICNDIALRTCLVANDLAIKIGDYGISQDKYKEEYYYVGDFAIPVRWCAPESLTCTDQIVEAKPLTKEANVWSFGVLLWELMEFAGHPYGMLSDEDVIKQVIVLRNRILPHPQRNSTHSNKVYEIMQKCWQYEPAKRPNMKQLHMILSFLHVNRDVAASTDFDTRWQQMLYGGGSVSSAVFNHELISIENTTTELPLKFESDFVPAVSSADSFKFEDNFVNKRPTARESRNDSMINLIDTDGSTYSCGRTSPSQSESNLVLEIPPARSLSDLSRKFDSVSINLEDQSKKNSRDPLGASDHVVVVTGTTGQLAAANHIEIHSSKQDIMHTDSVEEGEKHALLDDGIATSSQNDSIEQESQRQTLVNEALPKSIDNSNLETRNLLKPEVEITEYAPNSSDIGVEKTESLSQNEVADVSDVTLSTRTVEIGSSVVISDEQSTDFNVRDSENMTSTPVKNENVAASLNDQSVDVFYQTASSINDISSFQTTLNNEIPGAAFSESLTDQEVLFTSAADQDTTFKSIAEQDTTFKSIVNQDTTFESVTGQDTAFKSALEQNTTFKSMTDNDTSFADSSMSMDVHNKGDETVHVSELSLDESLESGEGGKHCLPDAEEKQTHLPEVEQFPGVESTDAGSLPVSMESSMLVVTSSEASPTEAPEPQPAEPLCTADDVKLPVQVVLDNHPEVGGGDMNANNSNANDTTDNMDDIFESDVFGDDGSVSSSLIENYAEKYAFTTKDVQYRLAYFDSSLTSDDIPDRQNTLSDDVKRETSSEGTDTFSLPSDTSKELISIETEERQPDGTQECLGLHD